VLRLRWPIVAFWAVVVVAGVAASTRLSRLETNVFTVPGTDSERVRTILDRYFGDRSDGEYIVVFDMRDTRRPGVVAALQRRVDRAAAAVPSGRATTLRVANAHVVYGDIVSRLKLADAKNRAQAVYDAVGQPPGGRAYVTGAASIQHDLDPIFKHDVLHGEAIAVPVALAVLLAVLGLSFAVTIPLLFAASTIFGTLGLVYLAAHAVTMPTYVNNLVYLVGLGIAVDYSLLIVYRFREELATGAATADAVMRTMETAGRAVVFSGGTVAIGLALLLAMPLPFIRAIGIGGFLIPVVSIAAAVTLQPVLLSLYGRRGARRARVAERLRRAGVPLRRLARSDDAERGAWARLARSIMRRPFLYLGAGGALLVAAAVPLYALQLTPGSAEGIPRRPQAVRGFDVLRAAVGPGALSPEQIVVDGGRPGGVLRPAVQRSIRRLVSLLELDPEVAAVFFGPGERFVDPTGRYAQLLVPTRHEYGEEASQRLSSRIRRELIPAAGFPPGSRALAGGGPSLGADFLRQSYSSFPWLVLAVLGLTYVLLLRAFRSLLLPLKAVVLNLLSVAAAYGMLVVAFRWGVGKHLLGLYQFSQIEGWIPIFMFAMLFGLSMDYEVFLVTRMREAWEETRDNGRAVAQGLERTGRIVTAAAAIMVAAFSGLLAGRIAGFQEFGLGLGAAILADATIVRVLLVPSLMAIMGRYNWWLPSGAARLVRVAPSPLR